jgi:hypothetical protein
VLLIATDNRSRLAAIRQVMAHRVIARHSELT